jgi:hypothetical protein
VSRIDVAAFFVSLSVGFVFWMGVISMCCTPAATPAQVYMRLIDGGCLAPSSDGLQAITEQHQLGDTPWLECMFRGGDVKTCAVPCK